MFHFFTDSANDEDRARRMTDDITDGKKNNGSPDLQRKEYGSLRGTYKVRAKYVEISLYVSMRIEMELYGTQDSRVKSKKGPNKTYTLYQPNSRTP
jgi:hypothetical protein